MIAETNTLTPRTAGDNWAANNFDFPIVLACMPFVCLGSAAAVLWLMRLMRVLKLFKTSKKLQTILSGLITGIESSCYIFVLIFIIFYMFAVFGVMVFKKSDPREFASLLTAFHTLFRVGRTSCTSTTTVARIIRLVGVLSAQ
jgi:voltage-gated sodium channel